MQSMQSMQSVQSMQVLFQSIILTNNYKNINKSNCFLSWNHNQQQKQANAVICTCKFEYKL